MIDENAKPYVDPDAVGPNPGPAEIYPDGTVTGTIDGNEYVRYPNGDECTKYADGRMVCIVGGAKNIKYPDQRLEWVKGKEWR